MDDILIERLNNVSISTKRGVIDQGFPASMLKLESLGYVKKIVNGYQITEEGVQFLKNIDYQRKAKKNKVYVESYNNGYDDYDE